MSKLPFWTNSYVHTNLTRSTHAYRHVRNYVNVHYILLVLVQKKTRTNYVPYMHATLLQAKLYRDEVGDFDKAVEVFDKEIEARKKVGR